MVGCAGGPAAVGRWLVALSPGVSLLVLSLGAAGAGQVLGAESVAAEPPRTEPVVDESRLTAVERYLERERADLGVPGMAAALVHGGEIVLELGLGDTGDGRTPVTPETPFLVASLAKSVTAVAVLQLVEDGAVDLGRPVSAYLPELAPGGDDVTVADLVHHRAGLSHRTGLEPFADASGDSLRANASRLGDQLRPAGFAYTNAGYDVLALLVQRVSGRSYESYLASEVFAPLGMSRSTTDPSVAAREGLATGHHHWLLLGPRRHVPPLPSGTLGSYRMFSSAHDLGLLVAAHLDGGRGATGRVLSAASTRWLHTGRTAGGGTRYGGGLAVFPALDDPDADPLRERLTLAHDGAALGYRSMLWMVPRDDLGFVLLANANDPTDEYQLVRVAYNVQRLLLDLPMAEREPEGDPVLRWGMPALALLALLQLGLALSLLRPLRARMAGHRGGRAATAGLVVGSVVDSVAVGVVVAVVPQLSDTPLRVLVQAPDLRILTVLVLVVALLGVLRLALWVRAGRAAWGTSRCATRDPGAR